MARDENEETEKRKTSHIPGAQGSGEILDEELTVVVMGGIGAAVAMDLVKMLPAVFVERLRPFMASLRPRMPLPAMVELILSSQLAVPDARFGTAFCL